MVLKRIQIKAIALLVLAFALTGTACKPQVVVVTAQPPASPIPAVNTSAPAPATPLQTIAPTVAQVSMSEPEPWLRYDGQSSLDWLRYGLASKKLDVFEMLAADNLFYLNSINANQPVEKRQFLLDLSSRLGSSQPVCNGYSVVASGGTTLQVWTSGWNPEWLLSKACDNVTGCTPLEVPWKSSTAGFFLKNTGGQWQITNVWLTDYYFWTDQLGAKIVGCDQPLTEAAAVMPTLQEPTPKSSCPGAPRQRLEIGQPAHVCVASGGIALRKSPTKSSSVVTILPTGKAFTVVGGPECGENWSWWMVVVSRDEQGWVSEGGDANDPYYVCPGP